MGMRRWWLKGILASLTRLDPEPYNQYTVKYIGNCTVVRPAGIGQLYADLYDQI